MARKPKESSQPDTDNEEYKIGYCKPPLGTRFQPGESGNRKGRPKGARSLAADLREELRKTVEIREGGKVKRVTAQRVIAKRAVQNGMKTERGPERVVAIMGRAGIPFEDAGDNPVSEGDEVLVQMFLERMQRQQALKAATGEADAPPSEEQLKRSRKKPGRKE